MRVDVITQPEELLGLRENWDKLYARDPDAHFFVSWTFLSTYLRRFDGSWFILGARVGPHRTQYVALLPLRLRTRMKKNAGYFFNEINMGGNYAADYTGIVCAPELADRAVAAFAKHLKTMNWTRLHLENLRVSERRSRVLLNNLSDERLVIRKVTRVNKADGVDNCICPSIELPDTWEAYLEQKLSSNTRQKLRRFMRKVEGSDEFRITHADASTVRRDIDILLEFWRNKWGARKGKLLPGILRSNRLLFEHGFQNGTLFLPVLWHKDRPLGALAFFVDPLKKTMLFHMAGRDETVEVVPPGLVLHGYCIRYAIEQGFRTYDFLRGNEPYKYTFGAKDTVINCFAVRTRSGRNLGERLDRRSLGGVLRQATRFHEEGRSDQAEHAYRQILASESGHGPALYGLGQLVAARGDREEAARIYERLTGIAPESAKAWFRLGVCLQIISRHTEAVEAFRKASRIRPELIAARYRLGWSMLQLGRSGEAAGAFAALLQYPAEYRGDDVLRLKARLLLDKLEQDKRPAKIMRQNSQVPVPP